jgi:hypothetical protein
MTISVAACWAGTQRLLRVASAVWRAGGGSPSAHHRALGTDSGPGRRSQRPMLPEEEVLPEGQTDPVVEAVAKRQVMDLQQRACGLFLLTYSPYWRRYVAIYMGECDHGTVLRAATPDELWELMSRVVPPGRQGSSLSPLVARLSSAGDVPRVPPVFPIEDAGR